MPRQTRRSVLRVSGVLLGGIAVGTTVTAAASGDRFLVDTAALDQTAVDRPDIEVVHDLPAIDLIVVRGSESDVESLGADYAPDTRYSLDLPLDDRMPVADAEATDEPLYDLQWDKQVQNVPAAHERTRGEGTRVAVIDTGVAADHPDLRHAVDEDLSRNFTDDDYGAGGPYGGYHGTHVAGIVAANDENDRGIVGTAPATEVVDCRVFSPEALAAFADIVAAIVYSAEIGADAANMSLGAYPVSREGYGDFYGRVLNRATTYANSCGTLLVAAAGNDAADLQHDGRVCGDFDDDGSGECIPAVSLPNEAANTMSVGATGPIGFEWGEESLEESFESPAFYTNYGTNAIDVGAPGGDADLGAVGTGVPWHRDLVLSTVAEPSFSDDGTYESAEYGYEWAAGTSMAAPQVAGAVALVASLDDADPNRVRATLEQTADDVEEYDDAYYGAGFLNPLAAVDQ